MRVLLAVLALIFCVWSDSAAAASVVEWTSDTAYIVFDGTAQANIIGSGVVASGSSQVALGKPQIEMSALVNGKAAQLGVAAGDSTIANTIKGIGAAIAGDLAAGSACSGGGLWGFIGCTALSAVTQAAVFLGLDHLASWLFGSGSASTGNVTQTATVFYGANSSPYASSQLACQSKAQAATSGYYTYSGANVIEQAGGYQCWADLVDSRYGDEGQNYLGTIVTGTPSSTVTVGGSASSLPSSSLSDPADPQTTADMLNAAWQQAASQNGYDGLPYPSSNPITASDVSTWESNNPGFAPTLGDDLGVGSGVGGQGNGSASMGSIPQSGVASDGTGPSGSSGSGSGTGTGTGASSSSGASSPSTGDGVLCSLFPNVSACALLGSAPAAPDLPSSSVQVSMSPWSIGALNGTCPAPLSVTVLGSQYSFAYDPLCTAVQKLRPLVLALCALVAALIVAMGVSA